MNKITIVSPYLLIITLNINGLNSPTTSHRVAKWIENKVHQCVVFQETLALYTQTESKGMENISRK